MPHVTAAFSALGRLFKSSPQSLSTESFSSCLHIGRVSLGFLPFLPIVKDTCQLGSQHIRFKHKIIQEVKLKEKNTASLAKSEISV